MILIIYLLDVKVQKILKEGCTSNSLHYTYLTGDFECNLHVNQAKYFFDAGDCCLDEVSCRLQNDMSYSNPSGIIIPCPEQSPCILSNIFCKPETLGDGICQDYNNSPFCDYDLGDCCIMAQNFTECCVCSCKNLLLTNL